MDLLLIFSIAIGLSMDAMAVAAATGAAQKDLQVRSAFITAGFFGLFQAMMPVAGWFVGETIRGTISSFDHWVAFILLFLIGIKMIYESTKGNKTHNIKRPLALSMLLLMAIATSIDAFAAGLSLSLLNTIIFIPALIIGLTTFTLAFISIFLGKKLGRVFGRRMETVGGIILIAIGIKILVEHL